MSCNPAGFLTSMHEPVGFGWAERLPRTETSEWLNLLEVLNEPAALLERALTAVDWIQRGMRPARKAEVIGTDLLGLIATLALRVRGAEVVALGSFSEPLLSPGRVKGVPGWKHVWMNPALDAIPLVQDAGASYVCASQMSADGIKQRFGPFDVIITTSPELAPVSDLAQGLSGTGTLIDLTLDNGIAEISTAGPTKSLDVKYHVGLDYDRDDGVHRERAIRNLALADALYPGWLSRLVNGLAAAWSGRDPGFDWK
jgi:glucose 1-dehydrogenase